MQLRNNKGGSLKIESKAELRKGKTNGGKVEWETENPNSFPKEIEGG